ncbi:hypothetical protein SLE2022_340190 [Rubroshorea leprosula]
MVTSDKSSSIKGVSVFDVPITRGTVGGLFVCWSRRCWPIPPICLLLISSPFTFCVASVDPPTPPLTVTPRGGQLQIALGISVSLVFLLTLLSGMGFLFRFLRLKKQRKSRAGNQVESIDAEVGDSNSKVKDHCGGDDGGSARKYSWEEIKHVTMDFARVIGSGGFSNVYLANLSGSHQGAVKVHVNCDRLNQVFKQELDILRRISHGNIVKLLGYCDDKEEGAMVFEYVPSGNLQEKLHDSESVLPWSRRTVIAFQLAQAIEYLHEKCTLQIVHGDIKASNILLDKHLNCKLCDFGSAKMGFSATVLPPTLSSGSYHRSKPVIIGSPGYTDPYYLRTGIASKKNDVYGLGVIILELVTGKPAFSPEKGQPLTSILARSLRNISEHEAEEKIAELVDPRLAGEFNLEEARTMLSIAAGCIHQSPTLRPAATQILQTLEQKIPSVSFRYSSQKDYP